MPVAETTDPRCPKCGASSRGRHRGSKTCKRSVIAQRRARALKARGLYCVWVSWLDIILLGAEAAAACPCCDETNHSFPTTVHGAQTALRLLKYPAVVRTTLALGAATILQQACWTTLAGYKALHVINATRNILRRLSFPAVARHFAKTPGLLATFDAARRLGADRDTLYDILTAKPRVVEQQR